MNELDQLTKVANGMLDLEVYREIFHTAARHRPTNIVEVGTAHGAATIALGLGAASKKTEFKIWTIDRLGGRFSSRSAFGSPADNELIVKKNIRLAGLEGSVCLFVGSSDEFTESDQCPEQIDLLMLDADGRIDRDLIYFYPRLVAGAPIIVDDVDRGVFLSRNQSGTPFIDCKHRITALLLEQFERADYIHRINRVGNTAFCQRSAKPFNLEEFKSIALNAYRDLSLIEVDDAVWRDLSNWISRCAEVREALKLRNAVPPLMLSALRKVRRLLQVGAKQ